MDEFNRLSSIKTNCSFQEAKKVCNKMKNRYETVYPCDDTRVKLQEIPGIQGSDYINANFVDSFQHKNSFIATQAPIECTIQDFWKMVWEQNSKAIVVLCKEFENREVTYTFRNSCSKLVYKKLFCRLLENQLKNILLKEVSSQEFCKNFEDLFSEWVP